MNIQKGENMKNYKSLLVAGLLTVSSVATASTLSAAQITNVVKDASGNIIKIDGHDVIKGTLNQYVAYTSQTTSITFFADNKGNIWSTADEANKSQGFIPHEARPAEPYVAPAQNTQSASAQNTQSASAQNSTVQNNSAVSSVRGTNNSNNNVFTMISVAAVSVLSFLSLSKKNKRS